MSKNMFNHIVKAVVDIEKGVIIVDAEMHSDEEQMLLESGSNQEHLWGINFYPDKKIEDENFIEFDSMINIRPKQGNITRGIENHNIQKQIKNIVYSLVTE
ncbi:hypothetical protein KC460_03465 [Candidatus Dependentiae bacterium]|nr:hypothetical protein [Candidatus Dependentiae bacterium]